MAIVLPSDQTATLTQGDILKGIALFATDGDWANPAATPISKSLGCLVMSRPCVASHKPEIIVASIEKYKYDRPAEVESFEDIRSFLESIRDGFRTPDRFYLGQIPPLGDGMFSAHFDSLHTLRLPPADKLSQFLGKHRVGRLTPDFARDLHLRFFNAFAALGFDDSTWYTDKDLEWLVLAGEKGVATAREEFAAVDASGTFKNSQHKASLEQKISEKIAMLKPFKDEMERRKTKTQTLTSATGVSSPT